MTRAANTGVPTHPLPPSLPPSTQVQVQGQVQEQGTATAVTAAGKAPPPPQDLFPPSAGGGLEFLPGRRKDSFLEKLNVFQVKI